MLDKSRLLGIFKNIDKEEAEDAGLHQPLLNLHPNSRVLLIDGLNLFLRSFTAVNKYNTLGHHVGGLTGALRSIAAMVKLHNPTKVIIAFDGEKGSQARKYLYREYKANRNKTKITNPKSFSTHEEEHSSKNMQITRLVDYLKCLPVTMMVFDDLEADDVIAYLAKYIPKEYPDSLTYIVSSDQDYMQLVNDQVFLYSPIKHILYNEHKVLEEYGVHPLNLNIYKALVGDTSDNLPGVAGVGEKNITVLFEGLKEPFHQGLGYIYQTCEEKPRKSVLYDRITYVKPLVETMFKVMDLHSPNIHPNDVKEIERLYEKKAPSLKKSQFLEFYAEDRLADTIPYVSNWLDTFTQLSRHTK